MLLPYICPFIWQVFKNEVWKKPWIVIQNLSCFPQCSTFKTQCFALMTNAVHKGKNWGVRDGQLCPSSPPKENKIFGTFECAGWCWHFFSSFQTSTHALTGHVYISLLKCRPTASKRSHSSLEMYPSLKSLAQSLWGVAAISSCAADLLHCPWHIA